jgi:hypothetical protein
MSENRALKTIIFDLDRESNRRLQNEELHVLYSSTDIIRVLEQRTT